MNIEEILMEDRGPKVPMVKVKPDTHRRMRRIRRLLSSRLNQDVTLEDVVKLSMASLANEDPEVAEVIHA